MTEFAPEVNGEQLLLDVTQALLTFEAPETLCQGALTLLAQALQADIALVYLHEEGDVFLCQAVVGHHPLLERYMQMVMRPGWQRLIHAGAWIGSEIPSPQWDGPEELNYVHLGARYLISVGLYAGERLLGTVSLLFQQPRPELRRLRVLGTIGVLWGTLLDRMRAQASTEAREVLLRAVTDQGTDLLTVLDDHGLIWYQSATVTKLLGHCAQDMLGQAALSYVHPEDAPLVAEQLSHLMALPGGTVSVTYRFRHVNGTYAWLESRGRNVLRGSEFYGLVIHSRHVGEQVAAQAFLERRVQELTLMSATTQALNGAHTTQQVAQKVVNLIGHQLHFPFVSLSRLLESRVLEPLARHDLGEFEASWPPTSPLGMELIGKSAVQAQSILVNDVQRAPQYVPRHALVGSELVVPIRVDGLLWGVLNIESAEVGAFTEADVRALETVAAQTGAALQYVQLFEALQRSHAALQEAYDQTIAGWARALDFRDRETEGHSQRVTADTVALARRMGLDEAILVHVRRGALLHDIGKMGIPDRVLLKPGALDPDEWAVMQEHPERARALLAPIVFLRPALNIPVAHHERWDGSGYPYGLHSTTIPLEARIFAVIDVWDALRNDRPYRAAWTDAQARAHIESQAGTHFDPAVVGHFLAWLDESADLIAAADSSREGLGNGLHNQ
ncbi:HD domain-containing phosphohydrolase [Deinococcus oregonensis]|uniref:HD domain-containing phosphohydrolase n=1 Tax=Deinococcus oregonensis TaxID=1805970 RepID=A0ABV6B5V7_9DEIO